MLNTPPTSRPSPAEAAAWQELERFSQQVCALELPDLAAVFSIGSLPGGYFRPAQSDLDVVVLFHGSLGATPDSLARNKALNETLSQLSQRAEPYPLEAFTRFEADLARDPISGRLPNPDLVARLLTQSRLLWGSFPLKQLSMPSKQDFLAEAKRYLAAWTETAGADHFRDAPYGSLLKHVIILMRYYMSAIVGTVVYNKLEIPQLFRGSQPQVLLPEAIWAAIAQYTQEGNLSNEQSTALRRELPVLHRYIAAALTAAAPET